MVEEDVTYLSEVSRFLILLGKSFKNHARYPVYKLRALQLLVQVRNLLVAVLQPLRHRAAAP